MLSLYRLFLGNTEFLKSLVFLDDCVSKSLGKAFVQLERSVIRMRGAPITSEEIAFNQLNVQ